MLNKTAPEFFHIVQTVLFENIILGISRITDPIESFGKKNVTIKAIPQHIQDPILRETLSAIIEDIIDSASFCRDWRNRHITHKSYNLYIESQDSKPLEEATRQRLRTIIDKLNEFFNIIEIHFGLSKSMYQLMRVNNGSESLMSYIEHGIKYKMDLFESKILNKS